jgi:hypothetical protein
VPLVPNGPGSWAIQARGISITVLSSIVVYPIHAKAGFITIEIVSKIFDRRVLVRGSRAASNSAGGKRGAEVGDVDVE